MTVPDDATDEEIIELTPEGLFTDLADEGIDVWTYYTASPMISAMTVEGDTESQALRAPLVARSTGAAGALDFDEPTNAPLACPGPWWPESGSIAIRTSSIMLRGTLCQPEVPLVEHAPESAEVRSRFDV
jgi:hypothetical protein